MSDLTISQALRNVARLKGKMVEYTARANGAVTYRADTRPAFAFGAMVEKMSVVRSELIQLETRIAVTNATVRIDVKGAKITLVQAIKQLQEYKGELAWLKGLNSKPATTTNESEVVYANGGHATQSYAVTCDLPEAQRVDRMDEVQASFDALNDLVEKKNHETPLAAA
jgi:hypothetical protein